MCIGKISSPLESSCYRWKGSSCSPRRLMGFEAYLDIEKSPKEEGWGRKHEVESFKELG